MQVELGCFVQAGIVELVSLSDEGLFYEPVKEYKNLSLGSELYWKSRRTVII